MKLVIDADSCYCYFLRDENKYDFNEPKLNYNDSLSVRYRECMREFEDIQEELERRYEQHE